LPRQLPPLTPLSLLFLFDRHAIATRQRHLMPRHATPFSLIRYCLMPPLTLPPAMPLQRRCLRFSIATAANAIIFRRHAIDFSPLIRRFFMPLRFSFFA